MDIRLRTCAVAAAFTAILSVATPIVQFWRRQICDDALGRRGSARCVNGHALCSGSDSTSVEVAPCVPPHYIVSAANVLYAAAHRR
jgi:hypothetical protein